MPINNLNRALESILRKHQNLVVVGASWGDEGKGKVIDLIAGYYDIVTRYGGGRNAGHTVYTDGGQKIVCHLIPCGIAQGKTGVIAQGVLFDAKGFLEEYATISAILGGHTADIFIDRMCPLWTSWALLFEKWTERARGTKCLGTTRKAIGPMQGLRAMRFGPVVGDLLRPREELLGVLETLYRALLPCLTELGETVQSPDEVADELLGYLPDLLPRITDTSFMLHLLMQDGKRILAEGAQALGLDGMYGTFPEVSSGFSTATGASIGTGLPMNAFPATLMVTKALPTRVGNGPFPSEIGDRDEAERLPQLCPWLFEPGSRRDEFLSLALAEINQGNASAERTSQYFEVLGDERGATTGRGRSVGWLDIPWLTYASRINGAKWLALTRLDMLSGLESIPVVTGYVLDGRLLLPGQIPPPYRLHEVKTVIEHRPGWAENICGCTDSRLLPQSTKDFLVELERRLNLPILLVGTGPQRSAMMIRP